MAPPVSGLWAQSPGEAGRLQRKAPVSWNPLSRAELGLGPPRQFLGSEAGCPYVVDASCLPGWALQLGPWTHGISVTCHLGAG